jgi:hypothetical protein
MKDATGIAFAGDLHHAKTTYATHPNMVGDTSFALRQITDYCREHKLDLIFLGDTFDKRFPDSATLREFYEAIAGLRVGCVQGQHDRQDGYAWPGVPPDSDSARLHLHQQQFTFGDAIRVSGLDYTPRVSVQERLKSVPDDCEILVMHGLTRDVMGIEEAWHIDMSWVPEHVKRTVLGDWHGLPQSGETEGRKWLYTGSATMRSVSEPPSKSFLVCRRGKPGTASEGAFNFERISLLTRPFIFNDIRWENELTEWLGKIEGAYQQAAAAADDAGVPTTVAVPFVALRYNVAIPDAYQLIMDKLGSAIEKGQLIFHPMPNRALMPEQDVDAELSATVSVQDAIDELVDREVAPELHGFVSELAAAASPKEVVHALKHRHQVVDDPTAA